MGRVDTHRLDLDGWKQSLHPPSSIIQWQDVVGARWGDVPRVSL